jgi:hypothetical protein
VREPSPYEDDSSPYGDKLKTRADDPETDGGKFPTRDDAKETGGDDPR